MFQTFVCIFGISNPAYVPQKPKMSIFESDFRLQIFYIQNALF